MKGNFIGTDRGGNADLGNTASGVLLLVGAHDNIVGGAVAGARNIISGNNGSGVRMEGTGTSRNTVRGNYIGTDKSGNVDLGNSASGVLISSVPTTTSSAARSPAFATSSPVTTATGS